MNKDNTQLLEQAEKYVDKNIKAPLKGFYHNNTSANIDAIINFSKKAFIEGANWYSQLPQQKQLDEILKIVDEFLLSKAKELDLYVDFSDEEYDGDKDAPMDRIGLLDYLLNKHEQPTQQPTITDEALSNFVNSFTPDFDDESGSYYRGDSVFNITKAALSLNTNAREDAWISVEDRLPDYDVNVLWIDEHGFCFVSEIDHDNDWQNFQSWHKDYDGKEIKIIAWQPLPKSPQSNTSEEK
jgi:hypothetical protein